MGNKELHTPGKQPHRWDQYEKEFESKSEKNHTASSICSSTVRINAVINYRGKN